MSTTIKTKIKQSMSDFFLGIWDSFQIFNIHNIILSSPKMMNNIKNCLLLNGVIFIGSILFYNNIIDPFTKYISMFGLFANLGKYFFYIFWLIPIFIACNILTTFWIDEIYFESLEIIEKSKDIKVEGQDLVTVVSNQIERIILVVSFILTISVINLFPQLTILRYMVTSILNSLYVFEYILIQKYIRNYKSIMYFIESKIFYFLGFGMLFTVMVNIINSFTINSAIFLIAFPFFLITSVKVNNVRFQQNEPENINKLYFLYPLEKFYDFEIFILSFIFTKYKNKSSIKDSTKDSTKNINKDINK
jgi:etoposide-induced 2.4 mRNA